MTYIANRNDRMTGLLHDSVTEAAHSRPDATAVIGEDRTFTYADLDDAWNRLASLLQSYRVEPGEGESAVLALPNVTACGVVAVTLDDFRNSVTSVARLVSESTKGAA